MKKNIRIIPALFILTVLIFSSCKKYPDGPELSLRSKKARAAGEWSIDKVIENGSDVTGTFNSFYPDYLMILDKDGSYTKRASGYPDEHGKWNFQRNNEEIYSIEDGVNVGETMKILRLKNKELWVSYMVGTDSYEVHFKQ
jgi:hypothetical protein